MKTHVNLLTDSFRRSRLTRKFVWIWLSVLAIALVGFSYLTWIALDAEGDIAATRQPLERQFAPLKSVQLEIRALEHKRSELREREQFALQLSKEQPLLTLIGLASQAARSSDGKVFVQEFSYGNPQGKSLSSNSSPLRSLSIHGFSTDNLAIARFVASLRDSNIFSSVELSASESRNIEGRSARAYRLNCALATEVKKQ